MRGTVVLSRSYSPASAVLPLLEGIQSLLQTELEQLRTVMAMVWILVW